VTTTSTTTTTISRPTEDYECDYDDDGASEWANEGVEMGGNFGIWWMDPPPSTDHLPTEEASAFLRKYYATAGIESKVWFQIKAKWVLQAEMEADGIEMEEKDENE